MRGNCYLDTSALAKWYINEVQSDAVEKFIQANAPCAISGLTRVEMRCLCARRRREGALDARTENRVYATFLEDIRMGVLIERQSLDRAAAGAANLVSGQPDLPLRTLDALHLAVMREAGLTKLVTADRVMAAAGEALDMEVITFFS